MKARVSISIDKTGFDRDKLGIRITAENAKEQSRLWKFWEEAGLSHGAGHGIALEIGSSPREGNLKTLKLVIER